jgi:hypothetical protein
MLGSQKPFKHTPQQTPDSQDERGATSREPGRQMTEIISITARAAQRKVNRFLLNEVSYLMGAEQSALAETDRPVWRVPIVLTYPAHSIVGQVGWIDVDTEN